MKTLLLIYILGTFSSICFASGNDCSFTGTVLDAASGKPMADVTIVAKGAALNNEQKVVTDEQGQFTIPLPAGTYTLRFEKNNYKPVEKKNLIVKKNPAKLNIELLLDENKEEDHHNWLLRIDFL